MKKKTAVLLPLLLLVLAAVWSGIAAQTVLEMEGEAAAGAETMAEEVRALQEFRRSADRGHALRSWERGSGPCSSGFPWAGVECSKGGHVSKLVVEEAGLAGSSGLEALVALRWLRVLSLKNNELTGGLPANVSSWRRMRLLFLSGNQLNGTIPDSISLLTRLTRLDLSSNLLTGPLPLSLNSLSALLTLRLDRNALSQTLPPLLNLTLLADFNVSHNRLRGLIPDSLARRFNASAFAANPDLCLPAAPCSLLSAPPLTAPALAPPDHNAAAAAGRAPARRGRLSTGAIIAIVVGDSVVLLVMAFMFLVYNWNRRQQQQQLWAGDHGSGTGDSKKAKDMDEDYCMRTSASAGGIVQASGGSNKLVFLESTTQDHDRAGSGLRAFDLEDLLRASAEMLGKGSLGSAYKAMLDDGLVVAVKRLKDVTSSSRREFEQHMELIARLRHPHLVRLRAFYYAKDEKLLVYDYMPNGSLHTLLHGNRGPGRVPVDWTTRVKIALGAAKGLAYIHQESGSHRLPHGNIKSSNILLDKNGTACVGDFGLALLMNSAACCRLVGYRAPEHSETRRISHKGDVFSFGVLLLEILTGKSPAPVDQPNANHVVDLPKWVQSVVREEWTAEVFDLELMRYKNIEEEMVALLQIAISCVAHSPDARPKMAHVVKLIEEIRGDISPARDESFDSHSNSSYLSEDAHTN